MFSCAMTFSKERFSFIFVKAIPTLSFGLQPILDYSGTFDSFNRMLRVTAIAIADELSSAAELVMEKTSKCPVVIIRDYSFNSAKHGIQDLIRPENEDLFR